jgi:hypothetical protein
MNLAYHYHATAALIVEELVNLGVQRTMACTVAQLIARADQMVDWGVPERLRTKDGPRNPVVTQLSAKSAPRLLSGDGWWAGFTACHKWHFEPRNGWAELNRFAMTHDAEAQPTTDQLMFIGAHLHTAQDTEGPHKGFVGYPCEQNYNLASHQKKVPWWHKVARVILGRQRDEVIGHMLVPDLDKIENCRADALTSAEMVRARIFAIHKKEVPLGSRAIGIIQSANDDRDLSMKCKALFFELAGTPLVDFEPFAGADLDLWWKVVA